MDLSFLLSNPLINVSILSWAAAQGIKTLIDTVKHKQFDRRRLSGAGGMPSSHSAVTCSVLLTSYYLYGFNSPVFALSFVVALIVMYDATGVRWAAGLHAKAINRIVEHLDAEDPEDDPDSPAQRVFGPPGAGGCVRGGAGVSHCPAGTFAAAGAALRPQIANIVNALAARAYLCRKVQKRYQLF